MACGALWVAGCASTASEVPAPPRCEPEAGAFCVVVGTGEAAFTGDDGPASTAAVFLPADVVTAEDGSLLLLDWGNNRVRRIDSATGTITTVAGNGAFAGTPEGAARETSLAHPAHALPGRDGGPLLAVITHGHRIVSVDTRTGQLTRWCGRGVAAYDGDDGPCAEAGFDSPSAIVRSPRGGWFVVDAGNHVVREVDVQGIVRTVVGRCHIEDAPGVHACAPGEPVRACPGSGKRYCGDAAPGDVCFLRCAARSEGQDGPLGGVRLACPSGMSADPGCRLEPEASGALLLTDTLGHRVRRLDFASGTIAPVAGTGAPGYSGDGGPALAAQLNRPADVAALLDGRIVVADAFNHCVRVIDKNSVIQPLVGTCGKTGPAMPQGKARETRLNVPYGVSVDPRGGLLVADTLHHVVIRVGL